MHTDARMPKTHPKRPENVLMKVSERFNRQIFNLAISKITRTSGNLGSTPLL